MIIISYFMHLLSLYHEFAYSLAVIPKDKIEPRYALTQKILLVRKVVNEESTHFSFPVPIHILTVAVTYCHCLGLDGEAGRVGLDEASDSQFKIVPLKYIHLIFQKKNNLNLNQWLWY